MRNDTYKERAEEIVGDVIDAVTYEKKYRIAAYMGGGFVIAALALAIFA